MQYTSGQMMYLLAHGVALLGPLVTTRFEQARNTKMTTAQRARVDDAVRAWESFKALCKWYKLVLRPEFTVEPVVHLDEAYFEYQV